MRNQSAIEMNVNQSKLDNEVLVSIRVLPHVKKYLERTYPAGPDGWQAKIGQNDHLGRQICLMLEGSQRCEQVDAGKTLDVYRLGTSTVFDRQTTSLLQANKSNSRYSEFMSRYTHRWRFVLPKARHKQFTDFTTVRFNELVDSEIKRRFYDHVDLLTSRFGFRKEKAVYDFMDMHGFSDSDINFRSLLKAYQRYELRKLGVKRKKDLSIRKNELRQVA